MPLIYDFNHITSNLTLFNDVSIIFIGIYCGAFEFIFE